jgi:uncharacterized protein with GYD domain
MPTYISLAKFTEQGVRNVRDTTTRMEQARRAIEQQGGRLIGFWWTQGAYDLVSVMDMPDEETATAFLLATGMLGNVRTETMRAYAAEEMQRILQKLPQG